MTTFLCVSKASAPCGHRIKEFVLKQFDTVLLKSGEAYQLCNTGNGRMLLLGAGNAGVGRQAAHARAEDSEPHSAIRARCRLKS